MTEPILLFGIPFDFILFAATLLGIALFHRHTLPIALGGLVAITTYKLSITGFKDGAGLAGLFIHLSHEFSLLANLFLLLMGFALLSRHFEESGIPDEMPTLLPGGWKGGVTLLAIVFVLSSFLDNIAGAIIGGTVARHVFGGKVHIGYLAAIVAASNAGGAGSVVGDTTTTMMWVSGVSPLKPAGSLCCRYCCVPIFAAPASLQQQRHSPIINQARRGLTIDWVRVFIVAAMLIAALAINIDNQPVFSRITWSRSRAWSIRLAGAFCDGTGAPTRLERAARDFQRHNFFNCACYCGLNDACREATRRVMADNTRFRVRFGSVRQHTTHGTRTKTRRL